MSSQGKTDIKFDLGKFRDVKKAIVYCTPRQIPLNTVGTQVPIFTFGLFSVRAGEVRLVGKLRQQHLWIQQSELLILLFSYFGVDS